MPVYPESTSNWSVTATKLDGSAIKFLSGEEALPLTDISLDHIGGNEWEIALVDLDGHDDLQTVLNNALARKLPYQAEPFEIVLTGYVAFSNWPLEKLLATLSIAVRPGGDGCKTGTALPEVVPPAPTADPAPTAEEVEPPQAPSKVQMPPAEQVKPAPTSARIVPSPTPRLPRPDATEQVAPRS